MVSRSGLFCTVTLLSTFGVVVCARDSGRSEHIDEMFGSRKMLQDSGLDKALQDAVILGDAANVQQLLDAGADPNTVDEDGIVTPLIRASSRGHIDVVRTLLNTEVDVNFANAGGNTALHFSAGRGHTNIVGLLLDNGADPRSENNLGWTPLFYASRYGHAEVVEKMIDSGGDISHQNDEGWTSLHGAASFGHFSVIKLLLEKGADAEVEAFESGFAPIHEAAVHGSGIIIQALIEAGADKDHRTSKSVTPLILAAYWGHQEAIEVLVENGADKSLVADNGLNAKDNVCLCTNAPEIKVDCDVEACEEPGRMIELLGP